VNKKMSTARKIRRMLDKGITVRDIAQRLKCSPQTVYNVRYQTNRNKGIGSLPTMVVLSPAPKRPRGRPRKVDSSASPQIPPAVVALPQRSLWQRVKGWFPWA